MSTCLANLESAIQLYYAAVGGIFCLTFFSQAAYIFLLKARIQGAPALEAQCFLVFGSAKFIAGILLYAILQPRCPENCVCDSLPLPIYPVVCLIIGSIWLKRGWDKKQTAGSTDEPIFQSIKSLESIDTDDKTLEIV
jgi:hypothetical protein